jgi:hypothetical protein
MQAKRSPQGIRVRHARSCRSAAGAACNCKPSYEASVYSRREGKKIRKSFPTLTAAKAWRADATVAINKRTMRAPSSQTLREAARAWVDGAHGGTIRTRSGDPYKPSALRGYEATLGAGS